MAGNAPSHIEIRGAREHNLADVDLRIPRDRLVVITGLSGSGKSSLAFDTLYAEGQRRYVESLSAYARQFLEQMAKPDVDAIEGLSPAIAIQQRSAGSNPRSTVGTITEIHDYLRLLFARAGEPFCWICGRSLASQTLAQMTDHLVMGGRIALLGVPSQPFIFDLGKIVFRMITLKGIYGREMFETWHKMLAMLESGLDVRKVITHRMKAADYAEAFKLAAGGAAGKIVLDWTG